MPAFSVMCRSFIVVPDRVDASSVVQLGKGASYVFARV